MSAYLVIVYENVDEKRVLRTKVVEAPSVDSAVKFAFNLEYEDRPTHSWPVAHVFQLADNSSRWYFRSLERWEREEGNET